jgi:hypothetical protein
MKKIVNHMVSLPEFPSESKFIRHTKQNNQRFKVPWGVQWQYQGTLMEAKGLWWISGTLLGKWRQQRFCFLLTFTRVFFLKRSEQQGQS